MRRWVAAAAATCAAMLALCSLPRADAQKIDPRRAATFVVGRPGGPSPTFRVDARRSGLAREALPTTSLRVAWSKSTAVSLDQPALAGADGTIAVVATRGDVLFFDVDGDERAKVVSSSGQVGPATMTSDGTVVFATRAGDVVGVRSTLPRPKFTTRIGGDLNTRAAPLALDDGGAVIATLTDLVVIDSEGGIRARTSLPEAAAAPLLVSGDRVLAIAASGAVYGWTPGREPVRLGSFGAAVDGGAALLDESTLVAVIEGSHLVDLDLVRGTRATRAIAPQGLYLGPPAIRGSSATVLAMIPSRAFVVNVDKSGQETVRAPIAQLSPTTLPDGGPAPLVAPAHVGALVDARGAVAFVSLDGRIGALDANGAVEIVPDRPCPQGLGTRPGVAGITPLGRGAFLVTCERGSIVKITGPEAETSPRKTAPPPRRPSSTAAPPPPVAPEPEISEPEEEDPD